MVRAVALAFLVVAIGACSPPRQPPRRGPQATGPTCEEVAQHATDLVTERRSATVLPEAADTFRLNITVACERSSPPWSEQTRRCYVAAGRSSDLDNCNRTLTADQIAALNQLLDRAAAGE